MDGFKPQLQVLAHVEHEWGCLSLSVDLVVVGEFCYRKPVVRPASGLQRGIGTAQLPG